MSAKHRPTPVPKTSACRWFLAARPRWSLLRFLALTVPLVALVFGFGNALAQPVQIVHQTNSVWSYHTNKTDPAYSPADAWTAPAFDDRDRKSVV